MIGEPDPSLVRFGGLVVAGELARAVDLERRIDRELSLAWIIGGGFVH